MFSEPVVGERFFGRDEVLQILTRRVSALKDGYRQNIALTGQSLAGKSSIILHFLNAAKDEGFVPVYVEVVKEPLASFADKFIATMLYNALHRMGQDAGLDLERIIEHSQRLMPKTCLAVRHVKSRIEREERDEAYSKLLELTSVLKSETGMSCIVILDEFDNLEHLGVKNPFLSFGKVIMVQKDTMYIVSSSRDRAIKKIISEKLSLLFGNFEVIKVANFGPAEADNFINIKLQGLEMDLPLREFLIAFTGGAAFYLDKIAARARKTAREKMSGYVAAGSVAEAILDLVYDAGGAIHQYLFNYLLDLLDTKWREPGLAVLIAMALGRNKQFDISREMKKKQAEVSKALEGLLELGLISKNGVFYKIEDALLGFWLKHVYKRRKDILVGGAIDRRRLFAEDLKSYMSGFMEEASRDVFARIAGLFDAFANELVQIESRHIRLPHFTRTEVRAFADMRRYVSACYKGSFWIVQPFEANVSENDVVDFMRNTKTLACKVSNKVIMPLRGMDENAKLLAKELRMAIWQIDVVNDLMALYGKRRIIKL